MVWVTSTFICNLTIELAQYTDWFWTHSHTHTHTHTHTHIYIIYICRAQSSCTLQGESLGPLELACITSMKVCHSARRPPKPNSSIHCLKRKYFIGMLIKKYQQKILLTKKGTVPGTKKCKYLTNIFCVQRIRYTYYRKHHKIRN